MTSAVPSQLLPTNSTCRAADEPPGPPSAAVAVVAGIAAVRARAAATEHRWLRCLVLRTGMTDPSGTGTGTGAGRGGTRDGDAGMPKGGGGDLNSSAFRINLLKSRDGGAFSTRPRTRQTWRS